MTIPNATTYSDPGIHPGLLIAADETLQEVLAIAGVTLAFFGCLCLVHHQLVLRQSPPEYLSYIVSPKDCLIERIGSCYSTAVESVYDAFSWLLPESNEVVYTFEVYV